MVPMLGSKTYIFVKCSYDEAHKRLLFGDEKIGMDTYPDEIQPGDGYPNLFVDDEGKMEYTYLYKGNGFVPDHFNPVPQFMSSKLSRVAGYFREVSKEMDAIIKYGKDEKARIVARENKE